MSEAEEAREEAPQAGGNEKGFFSKHGPAIFLAAFVIYLILLVIGVVAEIFDIQPILDWWIWRPPGK